MHNVNMFGQTYYGKFIYGVSHRQRRMTLVDLSVNEIDFNNGQPHGRNKSRGAQSVNAQPHARLERSKHLPPHHKSLAPPALPPVLLHPPRRQRFPLTSQRVARSSATFTADEATPAALRAKSEQNLKSHLRVLNCFLFESVGVPKAAASRDQGLERLRAILRAGQMHLSPFKANVWGICLV